MAKIILVKIIPIRANYLQNRINYLLLNLWFTISNIYKQIALCSIFIFDQIPLFLQYSNYVINDSLLG